MEEKLLPEDIPTGCAFSRKVAYLATAIAAAALTLFFFDVATFFRHSSTMQLSSPEQIFKSEPEPLPPSSIWCQESADKRRHCRYKNICVNPENSRLFLYFTDDSIYGSSVAYDGKSKWDLDDGLGFHVDTWNADEPPLCHFASRHAFLLHREVTLTKSTFDEYLQLVVLPAYFSIKHALAVSLPKITEYVVAVIDGHELTETEKIALQAALGAHVVDLSAETTNVCFPEARPAISTTFAFPGFTSGSYEGIGVGVTGATYLSRGELHQFGDIFFERLCENHPDVCESQSCELKAAETRIVNFADAQLDVENLVQPDVSRINFVEFLCLLRSSDVVVGPHNVTLAAETFQSEGTGFILADLSLDVPSTEIEPFWLTGRLKASWNLTDNDFCDGNFLNKWVPDLKLNEFAQLLTFGEAPESGSDLENARSQFGGHSLPAKVSHFWHAFDPWNSSVNIFWDEPWNVKYLGARSVGYEVVVVPEKELKLNSREFVYTEKRSVTFTGVDVTRPHVMFIYCVLDKKIKGAVRRSPQWFYVPTPYRMD